MSLTSVAAALRSQSVDKDVGFSFARPPVHSFCAVDKKGNFYPSEVAKARNAIVVQDKTVTHIPGETLTEIDLDGTVKGTGLRMTNDAFADLCGFVNAPVGFLKRLAALNPEVGLHAVNTLITRAWQNDDAPRSMVVDTVSNRIEGIVSKTNYVSVSNEVIVDTLMGAVSGLVMSNMWLEGTKMRATFVSDAQTVEPQKGDVVRFGVNVQNSMNGNASIRLSNYAERLVCTNGMVAKQAGEAAAYIVHQGAAMDTFLKAVLNESKATEVMKVNMANAVTLRITTGRMAALRKFLSDSRNGGGPKLDGRVLTESVNQAQQAGREKTEVVLWDVVNAVTALAHEAPSVVRRTEMEQLGFALLARFSVLEAAGDTSVLQPASEAA